MASASLCSSWACTAGPSQDIDYPVSETLRSIVAGALSISDSLSISPSGIMQRQPASYTQEQQQRGAATPALQQMLPQLPLPMLFGTPVQQADSLPLSPTGASWQDAWCTAAAAAARSSKDADSCKATSVRPSARRCLCLSLTEQQEDTPVAAAPAALPPVPPFTPHPGNCSISSSTPASAWSVAPAAAPTTHGSSSSCSSGSVLCSHGSSSNRSRLQAWLSRMELQLQVPATPMVPPIEPCPAPRGMNSRADAHASRKRALEAVSELRLTSTAVAAAVRTGATAAADDAAEHAERSRKRGSSGSEAAAAAAAVQIAAAAGGLTAIAAAADVQDADMSDAASAAAAGADDDYEVLAAAAAATAGVGVGAGGVTMPPPAFVLLGVLSAGHSSSSE